MHCLLRVNESELGGQEAISGERPPMGVFSTRDKCYLWRETVELVSIQWMDGRVEEGLALWNVEKLLQHQDPILNNCTSFLGHPWLMHMCTVRFSKKTEQQ